MLRVFKRKIDVKAFFIYLGNVWIFREVYTIDAICSLKTFESNIFF